MDTTNYHLRVIEQSDISHIHQGLSDHEITKYYDVHFETLEATQAQMDWYADLKEKGTGLWWAIFEKSTDCFVGAGGYCALEKQHRKGLQLDLVWRAPESEE